MLFKIGLFLIPFENFFFAPSIGWATIAPIVFFIYLITKIEYLLKLLKKEIKLISFCIFFFSFGIINAILHNNINLQTILRTVYTFGLGISFYFALVIRYQIENHDIKKDLNILFWAYFISMFTGIFQWIVYKYKSSTIIEIIKILSKRMYYPRVQFTFTEPSFIGFHLYGVVLIFYLFFQKENIKISKFHKVIMFGFPVINLLIGKSTKFILDSFAVIFILIVYKFIIYKQMLRIRLAIFSILMVILSGIFIYRNEIIEIIEKKDPRIEKIYRQGIYADGSLASRWFRINGSIKGYIQEPKEIILGYGTGNISIPFLKGYEEARNEYENDFLVEVNELQYFKGHNLFCMYIKIISEYGIIMLFLILILMFSKKYLAEYLILLYLNLQSDSYAFYGIWLYLFIKKYFSRVNINEKYKDFSSNT